MTQPEFVLYGWNTPNGQKIIIALEEADAEYQYHPIDISKGEQHQDGYRAISPDSKIPALIHTAIAHTAIAPAAPPVTLFESGAILSYLANVFPTLTGMTEQDKAKAMSWLFWQVGQLGPLAGQFGRFQAAKESNPEAVQHFKALVWRCINVMERQLSQSRYLATDKFTIADIACYPWIASPQSYLQRYNIAWGEQCPALARWATDIGARASVIKACGSV